MNSFGRLFRVSIFGESHGSAVGIIIDGCPAGIELTEEDFSTDIERRKGGKQKGTTPRQETDAPIFKSGVFQNKTTGRNSAVVEDFVDNVQQMFRRVVDRFGGLFLM